MLVSEHINIDLSLRDITQFNTLQYNEEMTVEDLETSILKKFDLSLLGEKKLAFAKLNGRNLLEEEKKLKIRDLRARNLKITFFLDEVISYLLQNYNQDKSKVIIGNNEELGNTFLFSTYLAIGYM